MNSAIPILIEFYPHINKHILPFHKSSWKTGTQTQQLIFSVPEGITAFRMHVQDMKQMLLEIKIPDTALHLVWTSVIN